MTTVKLLQDLRDVLACNACQSILIRFPSDGQQRNFALTCAAESKDFGGCDDCLKVVADFVKANPQEGSSAK